VTLKTLGCVRTRHAVTSGMPGSDHVVFHYYARWYVMIRVAARQRPCRGRGCWSGFYPADERLGRKSRRACRASRCRASAGHNSTSSPGGLPDEDGRSADGRTSGPWISNVECTNFPPKGHRRSTGVPVGLFGYIRAKGYRECELVREVREVGTPVRKATAGPGASIEWAGWLWERPLP